MDVFLWDATLVQLEPNKPTMVEKTIDASLFDLSLIKSYRILIEQFASDMYSVEFLDTDIPKQSYLYKPLEIVHPQIELTLEEKSLLYSKLTKVPWWDCALWKCSPWHTSRPNKLWWHRTPILSSLPDPNKMVGVVGPQPSRIEDLGESILCYFDSGAELSLQTYTKHEQWSILARDYTVNKQSVYTSHLWEEEFVDDDVYILSRMTSSEKDQLLLEAPATLRAKINQLYDELGQLSINTIQSEIHKLQECLNKYQTIFNSPNIIIDRYNIAQKCYSHKQLDDLDAWTSACISAPGCDFGVFVSIEGPGYIEAHIRAALLYYIKDIQRAQQEAQKELTCLLNI